jgi:hypothetical protein
MPKHTHSATSSHKFPRSPTLAADAIIGIMNRNNTNKIIGERLLNGKSTWALPITHDVMSMIMGRDIGHNFMESIQNPAIADYFNRVVNRLADVGFTIYYGRHGWMALKAASSKDQGIIPEHQYQPNDFLAQAPASHTQDRNAPKEPTQNAYEGLVSIDLPQQ